MAEQTSAVDEQLYSRSAGISGSDTNTSTSTAERDEERRQQFHSVMARNAGAVSQRAAGPMGAQAKALANLAEGGSLTEAGLQLAKGAVKKWILTGVGAVASTLVIPAAYLFAVLLGGALLYYAKEHYIVVATEVAKTVLGSFFN